MPNSNSLSNSGWKEGISSARGRSDSSQRLPDVPDRKCFDAVPESDDRTGAGSQQPEQFVSPLTRARQELRTDAVYSLI
jgi:hypothetical protein